MIVYTEEEINDLCKDKLDLNWYCVGLRDVFDIEYIVESPELYTMVDDIDKYILEYCKLIDIVFYLLENSQIYRKVFGMYIENPNLLFPVQRIKEVYNNREYIDLSNRSIYLLKRFNFEFRLRCIN